MKHLVSRLVLPAALLLAGILIGAVFSPLAPVQAASAGRVFELRTYTAADGKLQDLKARFRDHTIAIFKRHGIQSIGYWTPQDAPLSDNTLIYVVAHPSREAAKANWDAFRADPEWQKAQAASEANGKLVNKVDSVFMSPTDFSALK
jgi:hypothetical protein